MTLTTPLYIYLHSFCETHCSICISLINICIRSYQNTQRKRVLLVTDGKKVHSRDTGSPAFELCETVGKRRIGLEVDRQKNSIFLVHCLGEVVLYQAGPLFLSQSRRPTYESIGDTSRTINRMRYILPLLSPFSFPSPPHPSLSLSCSRSGKVARESSLSKVGTRVTLRKNFRSRRCRKDAPLLV